MGYFDLRQPSNKSILVHGDNRSGKSHLLASAMELPELNPLLIDADRGSATWRKFSGITDVIKLWRFEGPGRLAQLENVLEEVKKNKTQLLLFDSISFFLHEAIIDMVPRGKIEIAHWNKLFQDTSSFIARLAAYCPNFVFTAFSEPVIQKTKDDLEGKVVGIEPMVYGRKFPRYLMNHFNVVGHITIKCIVQTNRVFYESQFNAQMDGFYAVGDRSGLVGKITQPTLKKIFNLLEGSEKS